MPVRLGAGAGPARHGQGEARGPARARCASYSPLYECRPENQSEPE